MKKIRKFLIPTALLTAILCLPFFVLYLIVGPGHDFIGLRNTVYSDRFTVERYDQIHVGMLRSAVVDLLGNPLQTSTLTNYPVSALRDESVRCHYGTNAKLPLEALYFSRARADRGDYDLVCVWVGPDDEVVQYERWVTD